MGETKVAVSMAFLEATASVARTAVRQNLRRMDLADFLLGLWPLTMLERARSRLLIKIGEHTRALEFLDQALSEIREIKEGNDG